LIELTSGVAYNCYIIGMATQLSPLYLTEIFPFNLREMFGTANQLFIMLGIFTGSVFGLQQILGNGVFKRSSKRPANFQQMYSKYTC